MSSISPLRKLITKEDHFHLHKINGILVLLNFCGQLIYYLLYGTVNFTPHPSIPNALLLPHALLPLTSFFFHVLRSRPVGHRMTMFIWNELRLHAVIFSLRSVLVLLYPGLATWWVLATLILADYATREYGSKGISTVRGKHENISRRGTLKFLTGALFSSSQLAGTFICLGCFQPHISPLLVFYTLPAIQTSAFGMTLIRKNLITQKTWAIVYSAELFLVYWLWYLEYQNLKLIWYGISLYIARRQLPSKYHLWGGVWLIRQFIR
jgi:hypothetical protein